MIHAFITADQCTGSSARRRANSGNGLALVAGLPRSKAYMSYLSGGPGEQQEIAVGVAHDEVASAPGLVLERPEEVDAGGLVLQAQLIDLGGAIDGHRGAEQFL